MKHINTIPLTPLQQEATQRLAQHIMAVRDRLGLSALAFAARAGVSVQVIRDIESGASNPKLSALFAVAIAADTTVHALLTPPVRRKTNDGIWQERDAALAASRKR